MNLPFSPWRSGWTLLTILVLMLILFAWVAFRSGPLASVNVTVAQVEDRNISSALFGIGTVEARYTQKIGPTAAGRVTLVLVDVGDMVQPGQLLAQIDPIDLDQRRQELAVTEANLVAAKANRRAVAQDRGRLGAELAALVAQRSNLRLVAPRAGLVVKRSVEPGTTVVAGQSVVEIVDPNQLWINVRFDQTQSMGLIAGIPVQIALRSRPDTLLAGVIERVEPLADAVTEEVLAKARFNTTGTLPAIGELAEVTLALPAQSRTLAVPNASIHRVSGKTG